MPAQSHIASQCIQLDHNVDHSVCIQLGILHSNHSCLQIQSVDIKFSKLPWRLASDPQQVTLHMLNVFRTIRIAYRQTPCKVLRLVLPTSNFVYSYTLPYMYIQFTTFPAFFSLTYHHEEQKQCTYVQRAIRNSKIFTDYVIAHSQLLSGRYRVWSVHII